MTPPQLLTLVNGFSGVSDAEVTAYANAQGVQFARDASPIWGICPGIEFLPGGKGPSANASPVWLADTIDVPDALGYHDEDENGVPYIRVANIAGYKWTATCSHEALELKGDSSANIWALGPNGSMVAYELCDPVEGDSYDIDGVAVSNFVLPSWFDPQAAKGSRFDFMGKLTAPFTMSAGGYMIVWSITGQPTQVFGAFTHEIQPGLHAHFGPDVPEARRKGIVAKYRKTGRRQPPVVMVVQP